MKILFTPKNKSKGERFSKGLANYNIEVIILDDIDTNNGKRLDDKEMIKYYSNLAHIYGKNGKLTAKWIYGMAVIKDGNINTYTWSKEYFYIVDKPSDKIDY